MNQSNIPINEVLKTSLETQYPSVSFETVWSKYTNTKKPFMQYKKLTLLVAAILLLLISTKYLNDKVRLAKTSKLSNKSPIMHSLADNSKAKDVKQNAIAFSKLVPKKAEINNNIALGRSSLKLAPTSKANGTYDLAKPVSPGTLSEGYRVPGSLVIWKNISYYKTSTMVSIDMLGEKLGEVRKQTGTPKNAGEAKALPVGTALYKIKGVASNKAIAVKVKNVYYKAITLTP